MNKRLLTYLYIVVGLGLMLAFPAWADFEVGVDAYDRGDYDAALKEFRPLAEQGDGLNPGVGWDFRIVCTKLFSPKRWICASNF